MEPFHGESFTLLHAKGGYLRDGSQSPVKQSSCAMLPAAGALIPPSAEQACPKPVKRGPQRPIYRRPGASSALGAAEDFGESGAEDGT